MKRQAPKEITVEKLKYKYSSIPRNRYIADIFFKAGYIEAWGRGIEKIISSFIMKGNPEPYFKELADGMQVTLLKSVEKIILLIKDKPNSDTDTDKTSLIKTI